MTEKRRETETDRTFPYREVPAAAPVGLCRISRFLAGGAGWGKARLCPGRTYTVYAAAADVRVWCAGAREDRTRRFINCLAFLSPFLATIMIHLLVVTQSVRPGTSLAARSPSYSDRLASGTRYRFKKPLIRIHGRKRHSKLSKNILIGRIRYLYGLEKKMFVYIYI